ncbi:30S ribosomal protein S6 [Desulfoprunum benzoelyticum]|uniref:Small ribosomal subunit protein bS6 n=1 Tax=Desulfoprunum benzoelyticum TaxID=1506996 RepID=A0A840USS9_9BACT|nr:30S ribosomal protein S6 [Desulfoprunum benzoelyticum]MBB5346424.1 small subunit ribosomal protein S6 [Desulfoprunum benzoelyticum]MBM9528577.1 30S ribosomal protein S6 [Desulfoprunum benzoelyticum]
MRRYETVFILRPSQSEDEINAIIENTKNIILNEQGSIIDLDRWGMKKLAYTIKKEIQGQYVFCDFAGTPASVAEFERKFRIDDAVLKYLTIKTADTISEEEIAKAIADADAKQAALAQETSEDENPAVVEENETTEETTDEE